MKKQKATRERDKGNPYERLAHRLLIEALKDAQGGSDRGRALAQFWLLHGKGAEIAELCDMSYGVSRVLNDVPSAPELAKVAYG